MTITPSQLDTMNLREKIICVKLTPVLWETTNLRTKENTGGHLQVSPKNWIDTNHPLWRWFFGYNVASHLNYLAILRFLFHREIWRLNHETVRRELAAQTLSLTVKPWEMEGLQACAFPDLTDFFSICDITYAIAISFCLFRKCKRMGVKCYY